jgi:hypothetical protein
VKKMILILLLLTTAGLCAVVCATSDNQPEGYRIDIGKFTIAGVGLLSSEEDVRRTFGPPEEMQRISAPIEEEDRLQRAEPFEKRIAEAMIAKVIYAYFKKGLKITFREEDMSIDRIDIYISELSPYGKFIGSFAQRMPLEVREAQLLRPLQKQIYKDKENVLYLKKDDKPLRETAIMAFDGSGWLKRISFTWEENYDIDLDTLCVAGVCLGDTTEKLIERLGPPDNYNVRKGRMVGDWNREGLRVYARQKGKKIFQIVIGMSGFDGAFVQPILLANRKDVFHDYLEGRIYQEGSNRICAYKKGKPLSLEKLILKFDEDERLTWVFLDSARNVKLDFDKMSVAGIKVGGSSMGLRKILGPFSKSRGLKRSIALAYPRYGLRVTVERKGERKKKSIEDEGVEERASWSEMGRIKQIDADINHCRGLYSVPVSLAENIDAYKKIARSMIFRRKGYTLYLSSDGRAPQSGVVALVQFEKVGWPSSVLLKRFRNIVVDIEKFDVEGITLGTHADRVMEILGEPDRVRVLEKENLAVFVYSDLGIVTVINRMDRSVAKINIDMESFEGEFVQDLTLDSSADDYEELLYRKIYKHDEKRIWITPDGKKPTWEEAVVSFSLAGTIKEITFQTLAVKKEGILLDITRELE